MSFKLSIIYPLNYLLIYNEKANVAHTTILTDNNLALKNNKSNL